MIPPSPACSKALVGLSVSANDVGTTGRKKKLPNVEVQGYQADRCHDYISQNPGNTHHKVGSDLQNISKKQLSNNTTSPTVYEFYSLLYIARRIILDAVS